MLRRGGSDLVAVEQFGGEKVTSVTQNKKKPQTNLYYETGTGVEHVLSPEALHSTVRQLARDRSVNNML